MHISSIIRELPFTHWLNRAQTINSHFGVKDIRRAVFFRFFNGTCRPVTGINIICGGFITENIQRYSSKLTATAAMAEQYLVVGGDIKKIAKILLGFLCNLNELFATVTHFHHRRTKTVPVAQFLLSLFKHLCR